MIENAPVTTHSSGIRVETQLGGGKPQPNVRQRKDIAVKMAPIHETKPFGPSKRKGNTVDSEATFTDPSNAMNDYTGLTGQEQHMDNLLQAAYESDLQDYGY